MGGSNSPRIRPGASRTRPREEGQRQRDDLSRTAGHTQDRARSPCPGPRPASPVPGRSPGPLLQGGGTQAPALPHLSPGLCPRNRRAGKGNGGGAHKARTSLGAVLASPREMGSVHMRKSCFPCEVEFPLKSGLVPFSLPPPSLSLSLSLLSPPLPLRFALMF